MKIIFIIATLLLPLSAFAWDWEASVGQSSYYKSDNGIWWQNGPAADGFTDDFRLKPASFTIGAAGYVSPAMRWHVGYANLGEVSSYATATRNDIQFNMATGKCNGTCPVLATWRGYGEVEGIYFTVAPEMHIGSTKVFFEIGPWLYNAKFTMVMDGGTNPGSTVIQPAVHVKHKEKLEVGVVVGFGVSVRKNLDVLWRAYRADANGDEYPAIYQGYTTNLSVRYRF